MLSKSRSQKIRDYLIKIKCDPKKRAKSNSKDGPTQIVKALEKKGIKVTIHHVGMVKLSLRKKPILIKQNKNKSEIKDLIIAKKMLNCCNNDLNLAKRNLEVVSKLLG